MTVDEIKAKYPVGTIVVLPKAGECVIEAYPPYRVRLVTTDAKMKVFLSENMFARYITDHVEPVAKLPR